MNRNRLAARAGNRWFVGLLLMFRAPHVQATEEEPQVLAPVINIFQDPAWSWLGKALLFIGILLAAWILAGFVRTFVHSVLAKLDIDGRLGRILGVTWQEKPARSPAYITARICYWLTLLFGFVAALNFADLTLVAAPLEGFISTVIQALPSILRAALVLGLAYLIAIILRRLIIAILARTTIDRKLQQISTDDADFAKPFSTTTGALVYWSILFIGLVGAFEALNLKTIAQPLSNILNQALSLLPALATAVLILFGGYVLGRLAHTVIKNVLHSFGFDRLPQKMKLEKLFERRPASDIVGWVAMVLILLHASIAALAQLSLHSVSQPLTEMVEQFWNILPKVILAIAILALGIFVARLVRDLVQGLLSGIGFDDFLAKLGITLRSGDTEDAVDAQTVDRPSALAGAIAQLGIVLIAMTQVLDTLGLSIWATMIKRFLSYLFLNGLVAVAILAIGLAAGNYLRDLIRRRASDKEPGPDWTASAVRIAVLIFATTMALQQLDVAPTFVLLSFGLVFGALCLAVALAFGLGSRDVASQIVKKQYDKAQETRYSDGQRDQPK